MIELGRVERLARRRYRTEEYSRVAEEVGEDGLVLWEPRRTVDEARRGEAGRAEHSGLGE